jgi:hypothetical protein
VLNLKMCIHEHESSTEANTLRKIIDQIHPSPHPYLPRWHEVKNIGVNGFNTGTHYPDHELTAPARTRNNWLILHPLPARFYPRF